MSAISTWKRNWFIYGVAFAIALAFFLPRPWAATINVHTLPLIPGAVFLIFLLQGLTLRLGEFGNAFRHPAPLFWVLGWNYLAAPIAAWLMVTVLSPWMSDGLVMGFLYLGLLPTTVSSAIALTAAARGSVVTSVVSTALSNLLAVVSVPLWIWIFFGMNTGDAGISFWETMLRLLQIIFLPLFAGQILRRLLPALRKSNLSWVQPVSQCLILWILFVVFAGSFSGGDWDDYTWRQLLVAFVLATFFFAIISLSLWYATVLSGMERALRASVLFCGSHKGLATGAPMASAIFLEASLAGDFPSVGILLLPLLLYHPLQLIAGGWIAGVIARET